MWLASIIATIIRRVSSGHNNSRRGRGKGRAVARSARPQNLEPSHAVRIVRQLLIFVKGIRPLSARGHLLNTFIYSGIALKVGRTTTEAENSARASAFVLCCRDFLRGGIAGESTSLRSLSAGHFTKNSYSCNQSETLPA